MPFFKTWSEIWQQCVAVAPSLMLSCAHRRKSRRNLRAEENGRGIFYAYILQCEFLMHMFCWSVYTFLDPSVYTSLILVSFRNVRTSAPLGNPGFTWCVDVHAPVWSRGADLQVCSSESFTKNIVKVGWWILNITLLPIPWGQSGGLALDYKFYRDAFLLYT